MKLLFFEIRKTIYTKRFLFLILLLIFIIASLFVRNLTVQPYIENEYMESIEQQLSHVYSNHSIHTNNLDLNPDDEQEKSLLNLTEQMREVLYEIRAANREGQWQQQLLAENDYLELQETYKTEGGQSTFSDTEIQKNIALNQKLLDENIPPEHNQYSLAYPNFMKQIVDLFTSFGAVILLLLLIGDIMTTEFEAHQINLLLTQPIKKGHLLFSKFTVSFFAYLIVSSILLLITYLTGKIFGEGGTFQYPVLIEKNGIIEFVPISQFIGIELLLFTFVIFMYISLLLLFSVLFRHTLGAITTTALMIALGYYIGNVFTPFMDPRWNPFRNIIPHDVILYQQNSYWYETIPILLITSFLIYVLTYVSFRMKKAV